MDLQKGLKRQENRFFSKDPRKECNLANLLIFQGLALHLSYYNNLNSFLIHPISVPIYRAPS